MLSAISAAATQLISSIKRSEAASSVRKRLYIDFGALPMILPCEKAAIQLKTNLPWLWMPKSESSLSTKSCWLTRRSSLYKWSKWSMVSTRLNPESKTPIQIPSPYKPFEWSACKLNISICPWASPYWNGTVNSSSSNLFDWNVWSFFPSKGMYRAFTSRTKGRSMMAFMLLLSELSTASPFNHLEAWWSFTLSWFRIWALYSGFTGKSVAFTAIPWRARRPIDLRERNSDGLSTEYGELFLSWNCTQ